MKSVVDAGEIGNGEYLHPVPSRVAVSVDGMSSASATASSSSSATASVPDGNLKKRRKVAGTAVDTTATAAGAIRLHPADVLLGRSRIEYSRPGNKHLRAVCSKHYEEYSQSKKKKQKQDIINAVVLEIESSGARFVMKQDQDHQYVEVGQKTKYNKVQSAFGYFKKQEGASKETPEEYFDWVFGEKDSPVDDDNSPSQQLPVVSPNKPIVLSPDDASTSCADSEKTWGGCACKVSIKSTPCKADDGTYVREQLSFTTNEDNNSSNSNSPDWKVLSFVPSQPDPCCWLSFRAAVLLQTLVMVKEEEQWKYKFFLCIMRMETSPYFKTRKIGTDDPVAPPLLTGLAALLDSIGMELRNVQLYDVTEEKGGGFLSTSIHKDGHRGGFGKFLVRAGGRFGFYFSQHPESRIHAFVCPAVRCTAGTDEALGITGNIHHAGIKEPGLPQVLFQVVRKADLGDGSPLKDEESIAILRQVRMVAEESYRGGFASALDQAFQKGYLPRPAEGLATESILRDENALRNILKSIQDKLFDNNLIDDLDRYGPGRLSSPELTRGLEEKFATTEAGYASEFGCNPEKDVLIIHGGKASFHDRHNVEGYAALCDIYDEYLPLKARNKKESFRILSEMYAAFHEKTKGWFYRYHGRFGDDLLLERLSCAGLIRGLKSQSVTLVRQHIQLKMSDKSTIPDACDDVDADDADSDEKPPAFQPGPMSADGIRRRGRYHNYWHGQYKKLLAYKEGLDARGVPFCQPPEGHELFGWYKRQRNNWSQRIGEGITKAMSDEELDLFEKIGVVAFWKKCPPIKEQYSDKKRKDALWDRNYELTKREIAKGRWYFARKKGTEEEKRLGTWHMNQRNDYAALAPASTACSYFRV